MHNGIFHDYGGDRVRISTERGPASIPSADEWYRVKLTYNGITGVVDVTVNGGTFPSLHAVDLSLGAGKVGLVSFFDQRHAVTLRVVHPTECLRPVGPVGNRRPIVNRPIGRAASSV